MVVIDSSKDFLVLHGVFLELVSPNDQRLSSFYFQIQFQLVSIPKKQAKRKQETKKETVTVSNDSDVQQLKHIHAGVLVNVRRF